MLCFVHGGCEPISALLLPMTGPISYSMLSSVKSEVTHLFSITPTPQLILLVPEVIFQVRHFG
jgi:hypothetical protein